MHTRFALAILPLFFLATSSAAADHPGRDADCAECHQEGASDASAPKVIPEPPGFFAKLLGNQAELQGHTDISCVGSVDAGGGLSGCHDPEGGNTALLAVSMPSRPSDEFCGRCHAEQRARGAHHPTYRVDKDGDGVAETVVRPAATQEVHSTLAPANQPSPVGRYPDAIAFRTAADGSKERVAALPLQTVVELVDGQPVSEEKVVTCTTCHNPHYGYRVGAGSEEALNVDLVARSEGDALLRMRDFDNALCDACH